MKTSYFAALWLLLAMSAGCGGPTSSVNSAEAANALVKPGMTIAEVKAVLGNRTFMDERVTRPKGRDLWILVYEYPDGGLRIGFENGIVHHSRITPPAPTVGELRDLAESQGR